MTDDLGRVLTDRALVAPLPEPVPVSAHAGDGPSRGRCRPSTHGAIMGEALIALADAGLPHAPPLPPRCLTCAFRPGMSNQMAATGVEALKCSMGVDPAPFGCHHGLEDGSPTRLCAGYEAARHAPFGDMKRIVSEMWARLPKSEGPDPVRDRFDAWQHSVDPDHRLDDYQLARLYARDSDTHPQGGDAHAAPFMGSAGPKDIAR